MEQMETLMWEGQDDFKTFVHIVKNIGYKYVVLCFTEKIEDETSLGAACVSHTELVDILIEFSDRGFSCKVARVDVIDNLN